MALEFAYINDGRPNVQLDNQYSDVLRSRTDSIRGAQLSLLGKIPVLPDFSLFGRLGDAFWHGNQSYYVGNTMAGYIQRGTSLVWGGGGELYFGRFAVRAEFDVRHLHGRWHFFRGARSDRGRFPISIADQTPILRAWEH